MDNIMLVIKKTIAKESDKIILYFFLITSNINLAHLVRVREHPIGRAV